MTKQRSRRARILKRLLPHITTRNYDECDRYVVFVLLLCGT
jgi:hypothetical protein